MRATVPLRHVAQVWTSNVDKLTVDGEAPVQLCNYVDVYKGDTVGPSESLMRATATLDEIARFRLEVGDTLLTKDSEDPRDIGISAYVGTTAPDLVCGYHLAIARPAAGTHPRYLTWAVRSQPVLDHFTKESNGISRYGLSTSGLMATPIPFPSEDEQHRIADFLDDRVSHIDQIVASRELQLSNLATRTEADWSDATDFLSQHGQWVALQRFLVSIADGPFGSSLASVHYTDAGTRVIRLGNIGLADFRNGDKAYISDEYAATLLAHQALPGDVVMAGLGDERWPLGRCAVVPPDIGTAIVKADCYRLRFDHRIRHDYAAAVLSSPQARSQIQLAARGATRARLNTVVAREVPLVLVPLAEQIAYVERIRVASKAEARAAALLTDSVRLLMEYKQALITAAVTGELDVTTASRKIPETL